MISTLCVATEHSLPSAVERRGPPYPMKTVLLPVLTASLAQAVAQVNRPGLAEHDPGFISVVAMVETAWVLERAYGLADADVAIAIECMLQAAELVVENEQEVFTAMIALKAGRGSFADALISALGQRAGCSTTLTFDRKARHLPGFALL